MFISEDRDTLENKNKNYKSNIKGWLVSIYCEINTLMGAV